MLGLKVLMFSQIALRARPKPALVWQSISIQGRRQACRNHLLAKG